MTSMAHALARAGLIRVLTAYSGITTADGAADGTTLVDTNLIGRNDFITEKAILIMSGDAKDEDKGAASFDNVTGTITLQGAGFSAQIRAGTIYRVLNISSVEIDVEAINTKIGAFTATENLKAILGNLSTTKRLGQILGALDETNTLKAILGAFTASENLKAILGDLSTTKNLGGILGALTTTDNLKAILGAYTAAANLKVAIDAITAYVDDLEARLTAARAGYLDELGPTNVPADIDTLLTRLSAARAGYLDNLSAGAVALASVCTAARLAELDAANMPADIDTLLSRVTAAVALASVCTEARLAELDAANIPADIDTLLARLTATRAGYLDNINNADLLNIIRQVAETVSTFSFDETSALEQTMVTVTISARANVGGIWLDMVNVTRNTTIKVYHKIDATNLREIKGKSVSWVTTDPDGVLIEGFTAYRDIQIALTCDGLGAGAVNVPYAIV